MDELIVLGYLLTYINDTLAGPGALKGKNCTIQGITYSASGAEVTFLWTLDDGTTQTDTLTIANGRDGVSVTHNWNGTVLEVTSASGTTSADLKGEPGVTPVFTPGTAQVLPYGEEPQIVITGTAERPILNIAWPQQKPADSVEIPAATTARLGGIKVGNGLTVDPDGTLHNANQTVDLSDYYKRTETDALLGQKVTAVPGKQLSTEDYTAEEKAKLAALANYDDTAVKQAIEGKVDKEAGKGLSTNDFTTEEKAKLASLQNYDDTALTQAVEGKVDKEAGKGLSTNDYTTEEKTKLASLQNYDDTALVQAVEGKVDKVEGMGLSHNDLTDELVEKINAASKSMQLKTRVDTEDDLPADPAVGDTYFVGLEGAPEFEQYTYTEGGWLNTGTTSADLAKYLLKDEATELLAGKVDKADGKGLSTNDYTTAEKEKLAGLANYDDTGIREELGKKVDAVAGKGLSTNDYTTAEKEKLAGLANYDDTAIKESLSKKVDAAEGMGLSSNDYTTAEKEKLAGLTNYDDSALRTALDSKVEQEPGKGLFSGSYNDLTDKPEIPQNLTDYATKQNLSDTVEVLNEEIGKKASSEDMTAALEKKVDKELGKGLSTEDFTSELKEKLEKTGEIDDTAVSEDSTWSSKQIDTAKQDNLTVPRSSQMSGDFNDLTESGFYTVGDPSRWQNIPANSHGVLLVFKSEVYVIQIFLRSSDGGANAAFFYVRLKTDSRWWDWTKMG